MLEMKIKLKDCEIFIHDDLVVLQKEDANSEMQSVNITMDILRNIVSTYDLFVERES